jgi:multidrug efflux system membrane fusion protein
MKRSFILAGVVVIAFAVLIFSYTQMSVERKAEAQADKPVTAASRVERNASGETVVSLDVGAQTVAGLQTVTLATTTRKPEIKGFGRVMDLATLTAAVANLESARTASEASGREFERVKNLSEQNNISGRALEAAKAAAARDQTAAASALAKFKLDWGQALAEDNRREGILSEIASSETELVRIDLPAGETPSPAPNSARIVALNDEANPVAAKFLGATDGVNPQTQAQGFFFLLQGRPLTPGVAVTGYLEIPGQSAGGVVVPDAAVVHVDDLAWIYSQAGETNFTRREISLDHPVAGGWFVTHGVVPGDRVVVTGAQTLLSEERKTQIQMGD